MDIVKVLIEFVITFIIIYVIYYFLVIKKCRKTKKLVPAEVNLILMFHKIDSKKVDLYNMTKVVSVVTTGILSIIITVISIFFNNTIISLVFGTLLSLVIAVICYRLIGNYYKKKSEKKE